MDTFWSDQNLPDYNPPNAKRAAVAVAVAPVLVLLGFSLIIGGLIEADIGFAFFAVCTGWVVLEMHRYQKNIDSYNDQYASGFPTLENTLPSIDRSQS
jgi:multisubunit Na+/H+ antiporter MnhB subunit